MGTTNTFKAAILITGEVGASFRKSMSGATRETNTLGDALNRLKTASANVGRVTAGEAGIRQKIAAYQKLEVEIAILEQRMKTAAAPSKELTSQFDKLTAKADKTWKSIRTEAAQMNRLKAELRGAGVDTNKLSTEQVRLNAELEKTKLRLQRVDALKGSVTKMGEAWGSIRRQVTGTVVALTAAAATGYGLYRLSKAAADFAQSAQMAGRSLGMTSTELEQNRYAALKYGIQIETTDEALNKMITTTRKAREHLSQEGKAFYRLGLDARSLSLASPAMELELISKALSKISSERERAELGDIIFGKASGGKFAAFLADGAANLAKLRAEALEVGYATSEQANKAAAAAATNFEVFGAMMTGFRNVIGAELIPAITDALRGVTIFLKENKTQITEFFRDLGAFMRDVVPPALQVAGVFLKIARAAVWLGNFLPAWAKAGVVFAGAAAWAGALAYKIYILGAALSGSVGAVKTLTTGGATMFSILARGATYTGTALRFLWSGVVLVAEGIAAFFGISVGWVVAIGAAVVGAAYLIYKNWAPIKKFLVGVFTEPRKALNDLWDLMKAMAAWQALATFGISSGAMAGPKSASSSPAVTLPPSAARGSRGAGATVTNHVTLSIHPHAGQSANEIAEAVMKKFKQLEKQGIRLALHDGGAFA